MKITIHQPEHMPWVGYFHKMAQADIYVLLDNVQFKKNNWQNRNRIVDRQGNVQWLSVPVQLSDHFNSTIRETRLDASPVWRRKYLGRIHDAYCRHPFYAQYVDRIREIVMADRELICDLNYDLITFFRQILGLSNRLVWASELGVDGKSSELLLNICTSLNADTYIAGPDGRTYMDMDLFEQAGVAVEFHAFTPPIYPAAHYHPALSTLDLVMNAGPDSARLLGIA